MVHPEAPCKTPLGQDELRHRKHRLSQRHRTVLLLVDGHRSLGEVLTLAQRAGVSASHLEDLVRLGMVALAPEAAAPPPAPEPAPTSVAAGQGRGAAAARAVQPSSVESAPEADTDAGAGPAMDPAAEPGVGAVVEAGAEPLAEATAEPIAEPTAEPLAEATAEPIAEPAAGSIAEPKAESIAKAFAQPIARSTAAPAPEPAPAEPLPAREQEGLLTEVRRLLVQVLRQDSLLGRVFAPARVAAARDEYELIELVWEIERARAHVRRRHGQLLALERARELLGMGNTLVLEEGPEPPAE